MNRFNRPEKTGSKVTIGTVDVGLQLDFIKEVNNYAYNLSKGKCIKDYSLNTIMNKYVNASKQDLTKRGLNKFRSVAISKNTFEELLEQNLVKIN
jgi:chromosome segregation and condensation protein ScpB